MASVYAHRVQQSAGHVFGPYPLSLTGCNPNHQRPRHPSEQNEDDDENESELASASSEDDEDDAENDEEMLLDTVMDSGNSDWQAELPADDHHHPQQQQQQQRQPALPLPPPPIVVTYGPFHSPDVDVAVAYGQMVCYLWFWSPTSSKSPKSFDSSASVLQLQPQPHFIHFLSKVITQTQLSKTVLVLALHYLWLLKRPVMAGAAGRHEANMGPVNAPSELATAQVGQGSQYTVSVIALMLANKFMDDNTYTNKSWAAICGVTLERINTMEREFLKAINHALHVDVNRFMSWIRIMQSFFVQRQSRFDSRPRPRQTVPLPQHHYHYHNAHHLLASGEQQQPYANTPRSSVGYTRARSASPGPFQFTFVPPNAQTSQNDTLNTLPSSLAGRSMHVQRPVTQHTSHSYHQQQQRPVTSIAQDSRTAGNSSSSSQQQGQPQWVDPASSASALDPLFITIPSTLQRTRSKRSASQAFSPKSAEPPRPRPDERVQQHQHLIHPHPIHAHKKAKPLLVAYPSHHLVQHPGGGGIRRIHQVHEALASRPSTAVDINFSRMSLGSHGPSPVSDEDVRNRSAARHQQPPPPPHGTVYPHLAAPFDPYTAPSFRNEGSREGEPLELQYYQLVQGGRGVLRAQPSVPLPPAPRQEYVYEGDMSPYERECMRRDRLNSFGASSSAPGSAGRETRTRYPVSATFSTDDEEGMSGSESSNGTGWEHQHPQHPHQRSHSSFLQPGRHQSSHLGGGYSLPPLSSLLAETSHRFSSPAGSTTSRNRPSPLGQNVQYAEFANAGPPASYAPQWGFQPPISSVQQVQYPPLQTVFQSPINMEQGPHSDSGHGHIRHHHSSLPLPFSHSQHPSHLHSRHSPLRHAQVQVSPAHAHNAFTPQIVYRIRGGKAC